MYSKCVQKVLKILRLVFDFVVVIITNMYENESDCIQNQDGSSGIYVFKPFRYQKVIPNPDCKHPYPRSGHRVGADSANLYSFGGYNPWMRNDLEEGNDDDEFYPLFQELWKFNFASKHWIKYPNSQSLPHELASSALVLHGNVLMVLIT